jgi:hypothetical protein
MNKAKFFHHCRTHEKPGVRLRVGHKRVDREQVRAVYLYGVWAQCSLCQVELYRPAKQWPDWRAAEAKCVAAVEKFQCWLVEFYQAEAIVKAIRSAGKAKKGKRR